MTVMTDTVFGKRVLTHWKNSVTPDYSQMNGFMVGIEEIGKPHPSKNV